MHWYHDAALAQVIGVRKISDQICFCWDRSIPSALPLSSDLRSAFRTQIIWFGLQLIILKKTERALPEFWSCIKKSCSADVSQRRTTVVQHGLQSQNRLFNRWHTSHPHFKHKSIHQLTCAIECNQFDFHLKQWLSQSLNLNMQRVPKCSSYFQFHVLRWDE